MSETQKRPILILLASHWISMVGTALVTLAGFSWLFLLPTNLRGTVGNPYIGLLLFVAIPVIFFAGLALIPIGVFLAKRKIGAGHRYSPGSQKRDSPNGEFSSER